jgi:hypothetical protein
MRWLQFANKDCQNSTAEIIRWGESELPRGDGIKAFHFAMTGTARDFDALNRISVKRNGQLLWNPTELQLAALVQRFTKKAGPGATATRFTVPFTLGGAPGMVLGAPPGPVAVEVDIDNTPSATGVLSLAAAMNGPDGQTHYPSFLSGAGNVAAIATRGGYQIVQPGLLRAICIPRTTSLTSIQVVAGGELILDLSGPLFLEAQEMDQGSTVTLNEVFVTPLVPAQSVQMFLTVDGSFVATDEIGIYSFVPVG